MNFFRRIFIVIMILITIVGCTSGEENTSLSGLDTVSNDIQVSNQLKERIFNYENLTRIDGGYSYFLNDFQSGNLYATYYTYKTFLLLEDNYQENREISKFSLNQLNSLHKESNQLMDRLFYGTQLLSYFNHKYDSKTINKLEQLIISLLNDDGSFSANYNEIGKGDLYSTRQAIKILSIIKDDLPESTSLLISSMSNNLNTLNLQELVDLNYIYKLYPSKENVRLKISNELNERYKNLKRKNLNEYDLLEFYLMIDIHKIINKLPYKKDEIIDYIVSEQNEDCGWEIAFGDRSEIHGTYRALSVLNYLDANIFNSSKIKDLINNPGVNGGYTYILPDLKVSLKMTHFMLYMVHHLSEKEIVDYNDVVKSSLNRLKENNIYINDLYHLVHIIYLLDKDKLDKSLIVEKLKSQLSKGDNIPLDLFMVADLIDMLKVKDIKLNNQIKNKLKTLSDMPDVYHNVLTAYINTKISDTNTTINFNSYSQEEIINLIKENDLRTMYMLKVTLSEKVLSDTKIKKTFKNRLLTTKNKIQKGTIDPFNLYYMLKFIKD